MRNRPKIYGPRPIAKGDPVYDPQPDDEHAEFRAAWAKRLEKGTVDTTGIYSSKLKPQARDLPF